MDSIKNKRNIFLAQSYSDAWSDYCSVLGHSRLARWDWIVITASNEKQADSYREQLELRYKNGFLPVGIHYAVISDTNGERVGSGGATLNVFRYISENSDISKDFDDLRVLILHSGGDSKRVPQYSHRGKLFAPVPRNLPNGNRSTIFDEIIIATAGLANRTSSGVLVLPGDTELIFNSLQIDLKTQDAAALSIKASVSEGKEHGVFLGDPENVVTSFLHKQSESILNINGAVDCDGKVNIDTGCVWLNSRVVKALYSLICTNGIIDDVKCKQFINDTVRLSFYADFVYPLASSSSLEAYLKETPEGDYSVALLICRQKIWDITHNFSMYLIQMTPAEYIHFGTTRELMELVTKGAERYSYLGWKKQVGSSGDLSRIGSCNNSIIDDTAVIDKISYIENSVVGKKCIVGCNVILSDVNICNCSIPDNIVLHTIRLTSGYYVTRIYGVDDNPKASVDGRFLNSTLGQFIEAGGAKGMVNFDDDLHSLWTASIYPICLNEEISVRMALDIYDISSGKASKEQKLLWRSTEKTSLLKSFNEADVTYTLKRESILENNIRVNICVQMLNKKCNMNDALAMLSSNKDELIAEAVILYKQAEKAQLALKMRVYLLLSLLCKKYGIVVDEHDSGYFENACYNSICQEITQEVFRKHPISNSNISFICDKVSIQLPVRVNFCGSPSDAAPYCLEYGGTMVNAAVLLKGKMPILVEVERLTENIIRFESMDQNAYQEFQDISQIVDCTDTSDLFALHKAILLACGIISINTFNVSLAKLLAQLGGGIRLSTSVDVPKGSGLGTSSIIAAAGVKAVNRIFGLNEDDCTIYAQVFCVEQLMTTGGGWQDQVGGLTSGLKLISTKPGIYQDIKVDNIELDEQVKAELSDRFALIFSGQRRLARNVLRQEMNECIRSTPNAMKALERIRHLCILMKYELEYGNVDAFAKAVTEQFELVKCLDKGASNTCIEYIFEVCDDLLEGKSICGAGGGGFLQVILKKGVSRQQLDERLRKEFKDCGVKLWDSQLLF